MEEVPQKRVRTEKRWHDEECPESKPKIKLQATKEVCVRKPFGGCLAVSSVKIEGRQYRAYTGGLVWFPWSDAILQHLELL